MRGADVMQEALFTVKRLDEFVPPSHPLRAIRDILNTVLASLDAKFDSMYAPTGRDSIASEKLLRTLVLQAVYGIRSERAVRAPGLQHALPPVCRHPDASRDMGSLQLHPQP